MRAAKQVRAVHSTRENSNWGAVRQAEAGQAIAVMVKVLGIPKASLGNWVRLAAKGELFEARGDDKVVKVLPEQMEIARLRAALRASGYFTWLRPGHAHSAHNILQFLASTLHHLGDKAVGLLRADSGFFDEAILATLEGKRIPDIVAARLTQPLQRTIDQAAGWETERRLIVVRQSVKRKAAPGKTLALFADDPDIQGWRCAAFVTTRHLPMVEVWRTYRGRADCDQPEGRRTAAGWSREAGCGEAAQNRIKELKGTEGGFRPGCLQHARLLGDGGGPGRHQPLAAHGTKTPARTA